MTNRARLLIATIIVFLSSCTVTNSRSEFTPLKDSGLQILSSTNPYHGPNLLIARNIEKSSILTGYFKHNGAPKAIEVKKAGPFTEELLFYYPEDYRVYSAKRAIPSSKSDLPYDPDFATNSETRSQWTVTGPYQIGKLDLRRINNFRDKQLAPVFIVDGTLTRYYPNNKNASRKTLSAEVPLIPKPKPRPKVQKKAVVAKVKEKEVSEKKLVPKDKKMNNHGPNLDDPKFIPQNSDQVALVSSQGYARRAPNGDILHDVEGNAQTLRNIAHWYLGSATLDSELQETNNYPDSTKEVRKGTVVTIPQKLLKQTKKMPLNHRETLAP